MTRATARVGGVKLAYYVRGAGPPVLFVMGLGGRASDWNDRFLAPLAARFTAVTFDNRGTGASDKPMEDYSLEVMADEAVGVLDACRHARAHVVGISMGGMIAQLVALRHPARVDRLVLIATHGGGPGVVPPTPEAMATLAADRTRPRAEVVRRAMATITAPGFAAREPAAIEALVALAEAQPTPEAVFARQLAAILASRRMSRLGAITAPTLVVHGTDDPLAVRHARVVAEEEEAALRLDRAARPQHEAAVAAGRWIEHHRVRGAHLGRAIHHEAERALRAVLAEEHHRAHEVRITQLRHREQQGGSEGAGGIHGRMVAVARRLVNPTRPGARAASRRRPPCSGNR